MADQPPGDRSPGTRMLTDQPSVFVQRPDSGESAIEHNNQRPVPVRAAAGSLLGRIRVRKILGCGVSAVTR
jgi:hypothetical protein